MSRRTIQLRKVVMSGPLVAVRTPPSQVDTMVRSARSREELNSILPGNMRPEKRERILTYFSKK